MRDYLLIFVFLIHTALSYATDYYISSNGNDSKDGKSEGNAWKSIQKVNDFAWSPGFVSGDRILFEGGKTFTTNSSLYIETDKTRGTASSPVTFSSYGTNKAIIKAKASDAVMIWVPSSGTIGMGLKFTNLIFEGDSVPVSGPKSAHGILVWSDGASNVDYFHVENCEFRGFAGNGLSTGRSAGKGRITNITVRNVKAYQNVGAIGVSPHSGTGIVIAGAENALIEHCIAYKNGKNNNNAGGPVGIWFWDTKNGIIQHCESYDNETTNGDGGGFDLDGGCQNCTIQYCYSHNNAGAGYLFAQFGGASAYGPLTGNVIRYNVSQNDGRKKSFGSVYFWGNGGSDIVGSNEIYNNTFYMGGTTSNGTPACIGFLGGAVSGIKISNNIFIAASNYYIIDAPEAFSSTKVLLQNNAYYAMPGTTFKIKWGGTTYNSLEAWRNATGQEKNGTSNLGYEGDPMLYNAGNGGTLNNTNILNSLTAYKLKDNSPLIDAGIDLTKSPYNLSNTGARDYYNNNIPYGGKYDIGAHDTTTTGILNSSLKNKENKEILISPNPATTAITINDEKEIDQITIINSLGIPVLTMSNLNQKVYVINIETLSRGIYFIEIADKNGKTMRRLIKN